MNDPQRQLQTSLSSQEGLQDLEEQDLKGVIGEVIDPRPLLSPEEKAAAKVAQNENEEVFMELEMSNEIPDKTQHIAEMEVAEEVLSQAAGGGALGTVAMIGGGGALGTGLGAGIGAATKFNGSRGHSAETGAAIGTGVGVLGGGAAVLDNARRAP